MLKKLVIIADPDEVDESIVKNINATHTDYKIIISGVGKQCVENIKKSEYFPLIDENTKIINIGLVGCNGVKNYKIADVVKPKDVCKIKTVMKFESDKDKIPKDCFIDMEKSHLDTLFKNIKYIKIVSDFIDYNEYKNNLDSLKILIRDKIFSQCIPVFEVINILVKQHFINCVKNMIQPLKDFVKKYNISRYGCLTYSSFNLNEKQDGEDKINVENVRKIFYEMYDKVDNVEAVLDALEQSFIHNIYYVIQDEKFKNKRNKINKELENLSKEYVRILNEQLDWISRKRFKKIN